MDSAQKGLNLTQGRLYEQLSRQNRQNRHPGDTGKVVRQVGTKLVVNINEKPCGVRVDQIEIVE